MLVSSRNSSSTRWRLGVRLRPALLPGRRQNSATGRLWFWSRDQSFVFRFVTLMFVWPTWTLCEWMGSWWMYLFVPLFEWALVHFISIYCIYLFFFFILQVVCCCVRVYFMCIQKSVVQPKEFTNQMAFSVGCNWGRVRLQNFTSQVQNPVFLRTSIHSVFVFSTQGPELSFILIFLFV